MNEKQNSYNVGNGARIVQVSGQTVALGRLAAGMKVAYLGHIDDTEIQPFIGGRVLWDFENPGIMDVNGTVSTTDDVRAQISAGFNINQGNSQFSFETTYDGLGSNELQAITAKAMFAHQF
jgi:Autotransporter beta-domain